MTANCKSRRDWVCRPALTLAFALIGSGAFALSDTDFQGALNYDFRPPGARSLAMGGAFTALADDATASLVNPAGLSQLKKMEFSFAAKAWTNDLHLDWGGGAYDDLRGVDPTAPAPFRESRDFPNTKAGPAFLSMTFPFKRVAFSIFATQLYNFNNSFLRDPVIVGPIEIQFCNPTCTSLGQATSATSPTIAQGKMHYYRAGIAGSFSLSQHFSVGAAIYNGWMDYTANSTRYIPGVTLSNVNAIVYADEKSSGSGLGFSIGLQYRTDALQIGASYHRGEKFDLGLQLSSGQFGPRSYRTECTPTSNPYMSSSSGAPSCNLRTELRVPDHAALGVAYRPMPLLTLNGELEMIRWSQQMQGFKSFQGPDFDNSFAIKDAYNPHLGAEYVLLADTSPLSVRAGLWWEQGHRLKYVGHAADQMIDTGGGYFVFVPGSTTDNGEHVLYPGGGSQQHITAGIGFVVGGTQFDAGYDYAKWDRQFSLSAVWRFK